MGQGADLAVSSLHKMLPSLTQTAVLHASGQRVPLPEVARQTGIFQSSSPSYLLMASMDGCLRLLEQDREALCAAWMGRLKDFDEKVQGLKHLRLPGHGAEAGAEYPSIFALDPAKIVISTRNSALTGVELTGPGGETTALPVDGLFVEVGQEPDNGLFAPLAALDEGGYFAAGEDCLTGTPGIFVAGDCRSKSVRQLTTAMADGSVAALAACAYLDA